MNSRRLVPIAPLLTATGMFAQVIPAPPPPDVMFGAAGQMGSVVMPGAPGMVGIVSAGFSLVGKPVTGAPYSAVETTQSIQTLADGNRIVHSNTALSYRDSQGRIRHEVKLPAMGGGSSTPPTLVTISDPTTGASYSLNSNEKTAWKMVSPKLADEQYAKFEMLAPPPAAATMIFTAPTVDAQPSRSHEDLGTQEMEGVSTQGTRDTTVIPEGAMGNEKPITIIQEQWFSPDLKIQLKTLRDDPRMGQTSLTVSDLKRGEPDPSLFQVPSDYKIQEGPPAPKSMLEFHKAQ